MHDRVARKWRPSLLLVILLVLGLVLCLPIAGLLLFRFYANQLVQQTEESLLMQANMLAAAYAVAYADASDAPLAEGGSPAFDALFPSLSINRARILPPPPDALPATQPPGAIHAQIGPALNRISTRAQIRSLAGYRLVDPAGTVIAGSAEVGLSLAHVPEITRALSGETVSTARTRLRDTREPAIYAVSRGTTVRVFVAMPVRVGDTIIGAVYLNRTPNHIFRFLYGERLNLMQAALFVLVSTGLIALVFWRFVAGPIRGLIRNTDAMAEGQGKWVPPDHHGTREIAGLSSSFQSLANRLQRQQDGLRTYTAHVTHELKSPLTSVKGAAELLREGDVPDPQRTRFLDNILTDTTRMEALLASMRAFSLVDHDARTGESTLAEVLNSGLTPPEALIIATQGADIALPLSADALRIVLMHLMENAAEHGAKNIQLTASRTDKAVGLKMSDDGEGISLGNRAKIFDPFFTTRRAQGGTGMGLTIVKAMVDLAGGDLTLLETEKGTTFELRFAAA